MIEAEGLKEPQLTSNIHTELADDNKNQIVSITNPETQTTSSWFAPSRDPWYILLTTEVFEEADNAMQQLDSMFGPPCK